MKKLLILACIGLLIFGQAMCYLIDKTSSKREFDTVVAVPEITFETTTTTTVPMTVPVTVPDPVPVYDLTDAERDTIERVVMAEAGGESYEGQMAVAQCILNACLKDDMRPTEAVVAYGYTRNRVEPSESVKEAVEAVFDAGETAVNASILYFYAPAYCTSAWHESQVYVCTIGGHRFFEEG